MKMKTFALATFMTLAVTSAFAHTATTKQDGMMPSMDDQDYSGWKATFKKIKATPAGATSTEKMVMMQPEFKDEYDAKVYAYMVKMASEAHSTPSRPFDCAEPILSFDFYYKGVERMLNTYRRELIREDEARGAANMKMMGKPMPMSSGM